MSDIIEEPKPKKTETNLGIQDYLSLGYIFLLILGVFHETIYYWFLGINILDYSSVLDVLISPISVLTGNLILALAVVICSLFGYFYMKLIPRYYKWLEKKKSYQSGKKKEKLEKAKAKLDSKNGPLFMAAFYVFSMFIGLAIGRGQKTLSRINEKDITLTHELTFEDGEQKTIKMLGKNSLYVFYVDQEGGDVSIAPIDGNIKVIKNLKKD